MRDPRSREENAYVKASVQAVLAALRGNAGLQRELDAFLVREGVAVEPLAWWPRILLLSRYGKTPSAFTAVALARFGSWRAGGLRTKVRRARGRLSEGAYVKASVREILRELKRRPEVEGRLNAYLAKVLPGLSQRNFASRLSNSILRGRPPAALTAMVLLCFAALQNSGVDSPALAKGGEKPGKKRRSAGRRRGR